MRGEAAMARAARLAVLCAICAAGCAPEGDTGLEVTPLGDGAFRLTLTAPGFADAASGRALMAPAAAALCRGGEVRFGAHSFKRGSPARLVQELSCGDEPVRLQVATSGFTPAAADEQAIAELSERFLRARDAGDLDAVRALFDPEATDRPDAAWAAEVAAFNRLAGAETKYAVTGISWFENPAAAPRPGVYAALDYARAFERVSLACGFVVWRRASDGAWRIDREDLNYLDPAEEARLSREELPQARARLGCR